MSDLLRFLKHVSPEPNCGCWLWTGATFDGYGQFFFKGKNIRAHRVSYILQRGEIPTGLYVCHKCDVRCCVNPDHLYLGTHKDNMADKKNRKRSRTRPRFGFDNANTRLSDADVFMIRRDRRKLTDIAADFGISFQHVSDIRRGKKRWSV